MRLATTPICLPLDRWITRSTAVVAVLSRMKRDSVMALIWHLLRSGLPCRSIVHPSTVQVGIRLEAHLGDSVLLSAFREGQCSLEAPLEPSPATEHLARRLELPGLFDLLAQFGFVTGILVGDNAAGIGNVALFHHPGHEILGSFVVGRPQLGHVVDGYLGRPA